MIGHSFDGISSHNFGGVQVRTDETLVNLVEDWSRVRSPSRAARRRRQGHRQNIARVQVPKPDVFMVGNIMVGHPETIAKVLAAASPRPSHGLEEVE
ncbi:hypothetical protein [Microvirga sp. Mcv34]|uniref:hypothetical protein n=1 Tax=Microvirga sp. Mcv34 TaxID=2926016 RepID=UPI0021C740A3|nr:hypothetical protein [Microvirga sp. Mcv34]